MFTLSKVNKWEQNILMNILTHDTQCCPRFHCPALTTVITAISRSTDVWSETNKCDFTIKIYEAKEKYFITVTFIRIHDVLTSNFFYLNIHETFPNVCLKITTLQFQDFVCNSLI